MTPLAEIHFILSQIIVRADKASNGPWAIDSVATEGDYGGGENPSTGYDEFQLFDDDGRVIADTENCTGGIVREEFGDDSKSAWNDLSKRDMTFIAAARTDVPALCAALGEALARIEALRRHSLADTHVDDIHQSILAKLKPAP